MLQYICTQSSTLPPPHPSPRGMALSDLQSSGWRMMLQYMGVSHNREGKVWLNQSQISDLFGTSVQNVSYHIINILKDKELDENSVIKDYLITASDDKAEKVLQRTEKCVYLQPQRKSRTTFGAMGFCPKGFELSNTFYIKQQ